MRKIKYLLFLLLVPHLSFGQETANIDKAKLDSNFSVRVLHLFGKPYDNGYQHGQLLKKEIHELVKLWKESLESMYHTPADTLVSTFLRSTDYSPAIKTWTPELLEEMKGISDGCGIDFETIFAFQLVDEMWSNTHLMSHHCSSLGINNYSKDGSPNIIAQNIDITPFYHGYEIILNIRDPETGERTLVNTLTGFVGANGLNSHVGICVNSLLDLESSVDGLPVCCVVRAVLSKKSFEEAEHFLRTIKHASGQNYIIGSRKKVASFECAANAVSIFWPDSSKLYTYHTNRSMTNNSYSERYVDNFKQQYHIHPRDIRYNCPRYAQIKDAFNSKVPVDVNEIKQLLSDEPVKNSHSWLSTIMEFGDNGNTLLVVPVPEAHTRRPAPKFTIFDQ